MDFLILVPIYALILVMEVERRFSLITTMIMGWFA
jgi:hypothetical protein